METRIGTVEQFQPFDYQTHPEVQRIKQKVGPEFEGVTGREATQKLLELVGVESPTV